MVFDCFMIFTEVKVIMRKHSSAPDAFGMVADPTELNLIYGESWVEEISFFYVLPVRKKVKGVA